MTPTYLSTLMPSSVADITPYRLRNAHQIRTIQWKTQLFSQSFLPSTISLWNSLPTSVKEKTSLDSFRIELNKDVRRVPAHYHFGPRDICIQHARLRMHCSSLNEHLFSKNIVESPMCTCGEIEDTYHFFFNCQMYANHRRVLFDNLTTLNNITLQLLLFGDKHAPVSVNTNIFHHVHIYIASTKRFR